jgi:hypothetical protein
VIAPRRDPGETGLYVTFTATVIVVVLLGAALVRPRPTSIPLDIAEVNGDTAPANALWLDEPVEVH